MRTKPSLQALLQSIAPVALRGSSSVESFPTELYHGGRVAVYQPRAGTFVTPSFENARDYAVHGPNQQEQAASGVISVYRFTRTPRVRIYASFAEGVAALGLHVRPNASSSRAIARAAVRLDVDAVVVYDEWILVRPDVIAFDRMLPVQPTSRAGGRNEDPISIVEHALAGIEDVDLRDDDHARLRLVEGLSQRGIPLLGEGSQRIVFGLGPVLVGKVTHDPSGEANLREARHWKEWRALRVLLVPVRGTRADGRLLLMARAVPFVEGAVSSAYRTAIRGAREALSDLGIGDVHLVENWGLYNGDVRLLDYAYDV